jgi:hypothetical protein
MNLFALAGILVSGLLAMAGDDPQLDTDSGQAPTSSDSSSSGPSRFSMPSWIHFGGELRGRFEDPSNIGWVKGSGDAYYLNRFRLDVLVKARPWLRFYAQMQDARAGNYPGSQPNTVYNPFDIRQAYVALGSEDKSGFALKFGRQDITLGSGRLISPSGWVNANRSFDALVGSYYGSEMKVDVLDASAVLIDPTRLDRHKPGDRVMGGYFTFGKVLPGATVEPYILVHRNIAVTSEKVSWGMRSYPPPVFVSPAWRPIASITRWNSPSNGVTIRPIASRLWRDSMRPVGG